MHAPFDYHAARMRPSFAVVAALSSFVLCGPASVLGAETPATGGDSEAKASSTAATPAPALSAKSDDSVERYIHSLQLESRVLLASGASAIGVTLALGLIDLAASDDGAVATPYIVATGMPLGLSALVAGVPSMLLAPRYKEWYATNGPAPTHLARLKLMRRWRLEGLRTRRDAGFIGGGVLGLSAGLAAVVWGVRDNSGVNGGGDFAYNGADAYSTLTLSLAAAGSFVAGVIFAHELAAEQKQPHRLYTLAPPVLAPSLAVAPSGSGAPSVGGSLRLWWSF